MNTVCAGENNGFKREEIKKMMKKILSENGLF